MTSVRRILLSLGVAIASAAGWTLSAAPGQRSAPQGPFAGEVGRPGGRLVVALRSEPKTLNPLFAVDGSSREVLGCLMADLVHINRSTQQPEPALARSWTVSDDGRRYTLRLRPGLAFSDGHPMDAEDVLFTFRVYSDEKLHAPQRDLLMVGGRPIEVKKRDAQTVEFELAQPYAARERLFDSFMILPRHLLERAYAEGRLAQSWGLSTAPGEIAGLGPFRLKEYVPGQHLILERNPRYWKTDQRGSKLPYLDEVVFLFVPSEDAQVIRFQAGETDVISRISPENFSALEKEPKSRGLRLEDAGPGLEYTFLFFNLNAAAPAAVAGKQEWFSQVAFRQAVSLAIDREGILRLAFQGKAAPLWAHVTPGNRLWVNAELPRPRRSLESARKLLASAGFSWRPDGSAVDARAHAVQFSILTNAANAQRVKIATLVQDDLKALGIQVQIVPLENRALLNRVLQTHDYEACLLALGSGDADPNGEMNVWVSDGPTHLWRLGEKEPATPWEAEIDRLMRQQLVTMDVAQRKKMYDRVQQLVAENLPVICLAAPHVLVGAKAGLGNFRPAVLDSYTLWNVEQLFWRVPAPPR